MFKELLAEKEKNLEGELNELKRLLNREKTLRELDKHNFHDLLNKTRDMYEASI